MAYVALVIEGTCIGIDRRRAGRCLPCVAVTKFFICGGLVRGSYTRGIFSNTRPAGRVRVAFDKCFLRTVKKERLESVDR